jgi:O-antigen ligase
MLPNPSQGARLGQPAVSAKHTTSAFVRWAFYAFMASLPFEVLVPAWLPDVLQGSLSIPRIVGAVLFLAFVLETQLWPWRLPAAFIPFAVFFFSFTLSMLRADIGNFGLIFQQIQVLVLFVIAYNLFLQPKVIRGGLLSFVIAGGASAILMLSGVTVDTYQYDMMRGRLSAFGADPNTYAMVLMVGVLMAIGLAHVRKEKGIVRLPLLWGSAVVMLIAIGQSGSRGITFALAVGVLAFILQRGSLLVRLRNLFLTAIAGIVMFWAFSQSELLMKRWTEAMDSGTTSGRDVIFREAINMLIAKPIIGWGTSGPHELAARLGDRGEVAATHNTLLAMLTQHGILGTLPYLCGYAMALFAAWRARIGVEGVLPLALFAAMFVATMGLGNGLITKLEWVVFAYQLAAGQLVVSAARARAAASQVSLGTPQRYVPRFH